MEMRDLDIMRKEKDCKEMEYFIALQSFRNMVESMVTWYNQGKGIEGAMEAVKGKLKELNCLELCYKSSERDLKECLEREAMISTYKEN